MLKQAILPLTGLRFIAAFFVLIGHLLPSVMPFKERPIWYEQITSLSAEGMSLFFILSGFVIHYNYSNIVGNGKGWTGLWNFFVARFARLYPLYLVILVYQVLFDYSYSNLQPTTKSVLPVYLLMAQSWFYWPIGKYGLIYELGLLIPLTWSISTEWFFYLCYPAIKVMLTKLKGIGTKLFVCLAFSFVSYCVLLVAAQHTDLINKFGVHLFGKTSDAANVGQYVFSRWLIYMSPYSRISEFILGCLCASIYMDYQKKFPSAREEKCGLICLLIVIAATTLLHFFIFLPPNIPGSLAAINGIHMSFGFAPFLALIIFCCARYQNFISRFLSSSMLVLGGEASYSLYLWHMLVVMAMRWEAAPVNSFIVGMGDFLRLLPSIGMAVGLSLVSWRIIELPARDWLRKKLSIKTKLSYERKEQINNVLADKSLCEPLHHS